MGSDLPIRRLIPVIVGVACLGLAALAFAVFVWPTYHWRPEAPCHSGILVLDLKGDGFDLHEKETYTSYFAHEGDWFFQATGWPNGGRDGILALAQTDRNIDGLHDLVAVLPSDVLKGVSAFDKLAAFDTNRDGLVDANDREFERLRIWVDRDSDGLTDPGDLVLPEAVGVRALQVARGGSGPEIAGNKVLSEGAFLDAQGREKEMSEFGFGYDHLMTYDSERATVPAPVMALPAMRGYGKTRGLRLSMNRDRKLFGLVQNLTFWFGEEGHDLAPPDLTARIQQIVIRWSLAEDIDPQSRGGFLDARHLATLEHIRGVPYFETWGGGANPSPGAALEQESKWDNLALAVGTRLLVQGLLGRCFKGAKFLWETDTFGGDVDIEASIACAERYAPRGHPERFRALEAAVAYWKPVTAALDEIARDLKIAPATYESQLDQAVRAGGVPDGLDFLRTHSVRQARSMTPEIVFAGNGPTLIYGGAGADRLHGGPDDDTIAGDAGNDMLAGGDGSDTYLVGRDSGRDVIFEPAILTFARDEIAFDSGIRPDEVRLERVTEGSDDLRIILGDRRTTITVKAQFQWQGIERIRFADGPIWDRDEIAARASGSGS